MHLSHPSQVNLDRFLGGMDDSREIVSPSSRHCGGKTLLLFFSQSTSKYFKSGSRSVVSSGSDAGGEPSDSRSAAESQSQSGVPKQVDASQSTGGSLQSSNTILGIPQP